MRKSPLMLRHLNTWSQIGGTVWKGFGMFGGVLLKELDH